MQRLPKVVPNGLPLNLRLFVNINSALGGLHSALVSRREIMEKLVQLLNLLVAYKSASGYARPDPRPVYQSIADQIPKDVERQRDEMTSVMSRLYQSLAEDNFQESDRLERELVERIATYMHTFNNLQLPLLKTGFGGPPSDEPPPGGSGSEGQDPPGPSTGAQPGGSVHGGPLKNGGSGLSSTSGKGYNRNQYHQHADHTVDKFLGPSEFWVFYCTTAVFSSLTSLVHQAAIRSPIRAMGAYAPIAALLSYGLMKNSNARIGEDDFLGFTFTTKHGVYSLILFNIFSLILVSRFRLPIIDPAAHLGGISFGAFYALIGEQFMRSHFEGGVMDV